MERKKFRDSSSSFRDVSGQGKHEVKLSLRLVGYHRAISTQLGLESPMLVSTIGHGLDPSFLQPGAEIYIPSAVFGRLRLPITITITTKGVSGGWDGTSRSWKCTIRALCRASLPWGPSCMGLTANTKVTVPSYPNSGFPIPFGAADRGNSTGSSAVAPACRARASML